MGSGDRYEVLPEKDYSMQYQMAMQTSLQTQMAQIGAQMIGMDQMRMTQQSRTAADLALGLERLRTNLDVMSMTYEQKVLEESNRHIEATEEAKLKYASNNAGSQIDMESFFADSANG